MKKRSFTWDVVKGAFKKPATVSYKGGDFTLDSRVRGKLSYDRAQCVACGLCMKDCPTGAIKVINEGTKENKDMHAYLDMGRCIFCAQCVDSCAKHCLSYTSESNLAMLSRDELTVEL